MNKLGFIGVGNMGFALLKGFAASPLGNGTNICAYDIDESRAGLLKPLGVDFSSDVTVITQHCDCIIIAVKPQQTGDLLANIKPFIREQVIVSICAGISIEYIENKLSDSAKIVQVMPNTPVMLGLGASAVARNKNVSDEEFGFVRSVFDSSGISEVIPPDKMNEVIAVNGSSPAFIYAFAKCFSDYAHSVGIEDKAALKLFSQSLIGAGTMLLNSGMSPEELIKQVSSKGGTTVAGLAELQNGLGEIVGKTCKACTKRAYELGKMD